MPYFCLWNKIFIYIIGPALVEYKSKNYFVNQFFGAHSIIWEYVVKDHDFSFKNGVTIHIRLATRAIWSGLGKVNAVAAAVVAAVGIHSYRLGMFYHNLDILRCIPFVLPNAHLFPLHITFLYYDNHVTRKLGDLHPPLFLCHQVCFFCAKGISCHL